MHLAGIPPHDPLATPGDREGALVNNMVAHTHTHTLTHTHSHTHTPSHLSRSLGALGYLLLCLQIEHEIPHLLLKVSHLLYNDTQTTSFTQPTHIVSRPSCECKLEVKLHKKGSLTCGVFSPSLSV